VLLTTDDDPAGSDATASTTIVSARPTTTTSTLPLAPGCAAFEEIRAQQQTSERVTDLLVQVYLSPGDDVALDATIDALDQYVEEQLPAISDAMAQVATDLPDKREGALLVRRFFVGVIRALDESDDRDTIVSTLEGFYTREDAEGALTAIADFVQYDLDHCPQPVR
jgi:hypothetical protein